MQPRLRLTDLITYQLLAHSISGANVDSRWALSDRGRLRLSWFCAPGLLTACVLFTFAQHVCHDDQNDHPVAATSFLYAKKFEGVRILGLRR
jgi:hypothetical protein